MKSMPIQITAVRCKDGPPSPPGESARLRPTSELTSSPLIARQQTRPETRFYLIHHPRTLSLGKRAGVRAGALQFFQRCLSNAVLLTVLSATSVAHAKLNVVATLPDYGSIAGEIGGDKVKVTSL